MVGLLVLLCGHAQARSKIKLRNVTVEELLPLATVPTAAATLLAAPAAVAPTVGAADGVGGSSSSSSSAASASSTAASGVAAAAPLSAGSHLSNADFLFVAGACKKRLPLLRAGRSWRMGSTPGAASASSAAQAAATGSAQDGAVGAAAGATSSDGGGIRSFILVEEAKPERLHALNSEGASFGEVYGFFPDEGSEMLGGQVHGRKAGDTRAAVAPFAAHRHFEQAGYKWMLYGDDDTVFFMDSVREMLSKYDHTQPLALSDHLWFNTRHPNPHAPRCLPCHLKDAGLPTLEQIFQSPAGRREVLTQFHLHKFFRWRNADVEAFVRNGTALGARYAPHVACPYCTPKDACPPGQPCEGATAHGGAGMIFSVGLLRAIPYASALQCILNLLRTPGSDYLVCRCLWQHGFGFTDPGPSVRHMYDPHYVVFGGGTRHGVLRDPLGTVQSGRCDAECGWMLRNVVSLHASARQSRDWQELASTIANLPRARAEAQVLLAAQLANRSKVIEREPWRRRGY